jgi:hypothetical protein
VIKALHLGQFEHVLRTKDSPRYDLYRELNEKGSPTRNLWQRLHTPYDWQIPETIMQITADLFDLYVVFYDISNLYGSNPSWVSVRAYGSYSTQHVFIRGAKKDGVWIFEPMIPDSKKVRASEFSYTNLMTKDSPARLLPRPVLRTPTKLQ